MGRTLSGYKSEGRDTIPEIGAKYCPVGADNDPTGMNKNWVPEVTKEYERLKGLTSTNTTSSNTSGSSFFNGWQGRVTQKYSAGHGGLDIDGKTGDTLTALSGGKISFLYMDDGGKYDPDAMNSRAGGAEIGVMMPNGKQYFYSHLSNVNPEILQRWANGDRNIGINPGDYIGNIGGTPGVPGSGYSTTGDHLHLGLIDSNGNKINPEELLNSLNSGNSSIGDTGSSSHITVDININGDGAGKLNSMTISALKSLVQQTVEEIERRRLITQPAVRR
jgi:hypothetical protein